MSIVRKSFEKTWRITCNIPLLPVMYKSYKQTKTSLHVYKCTTNDIFLLGEHFKKKINKVLSFAGAYTGVVDSPF